MRREQERSFRNTPPPKNRAGTATPPPRAGRPDLHLPTDVLIEHLCYDLSRARPRRVLRAGRSSAAAAAWNPTSKCGTIKCYARLARAAISHRSGQNRPPHHEVSRMVYDPANPLIVQSDRSILLEVDNPRYEAARDDLARFAELEKSPEHIHTYRVTPLSLWNAAASGSTAAEINAALLRYSKFDLPSNVLADIEDYIGRFGRVKLLHDDGRLVLRSDDTLLITEIARNAHTKLFLRGRIDEHTLE